MRLNPSFTLTALVLVLLLGSTAVRPAEVTLRRLRDSTDPARAVVRIRAGERSPHRVPKHITGKFAEHLGSNIYGGMDAQVLRNPTFAEWPFWTGGMTPDGVTKFHAEDNRIEEELRRQASRFGWPEGEVEGLVAGRADGLACWWTRVGQRSAVQVSPDTSPWGSRAQRIAVRTSGEGIAQWVRLPLHRVRQFEFELFARSREVVALAVSLAAEGARMPATAATVEGLNGDWKVFRGTLRLPGDLPADGVYRFTVTADSPGQFVLGRTVLRPVDHVNGADPDVVRWLREARLPLLRWPGGNFVSGYHWEDGIGPVERRPTRPNYAWGGVEPNLFGTDEFIAFCRAVGCEPMICLNAGSGTAAEAARWVEYCNGPPTSPMGALRAANGHPEPYGVQHWEVGNELWGHWQYYWTTAAGYVDRYREFARAVRAADPAIELYACGAPVFWGKAWNDELIKGAAPELRTTTDHPLIGGTVAPAVEPLDVYRDFLAVPEVLERKWAELRRAMLEAGIKEPRLAVTELQMFAHLGHAPEGGSPPRLRPENLVNPGTLAEGLYDVLIYHAAVRLGPFVSMVTHSATVNHGGGLRKERERVYANPCHYAQAAFAAFAEATPVALELEAASQPAPLVLPELKNTVHHASYTVVDALAAVGTDGSLLVSLVHRGSAGPIHVTIECADFKGGPTAEVHTLSGEVPWAANSLQAPKAVAPVESALAWQDGKAALDLRPYSVVRVRVPARVAATSTPRRGSSPTASLHPPQSPAPAGPL